MVPLADALEAEHRTIDRGIEAYVGAGPADDGAAARLAESLAGLRRHIYLEEELLFPTFRAAGLVGPVMVMEREHAAMWATLEVLDAQLSAGARHEDVAARCRELLDVLDAHNAKEEHILYAQADTLLSDEAQSVLTDFLASGRLPDGWVCVGART